MSSSSTCHFCARATPAGSKFCNHCGEPLDLKPCKHCDAFNHVAVDRCYQCGTLFAPRQDALAVAETGTSAAVTSPAARPPAAPAARSARVGPAFGPLEHTPVALSDRMEACTERVAERLGDAPPPPLMPFAAAASEEPDDDADWVDPRRQWEARLESHARQRARAAAAAVAAVLLCAVAAGGYVAYDSGWLIRAGAWARAAGQGVVASSSAIVTKLAADIGHERKSAPSPPSGTPSSNDSGTTRAATSGPAPRSAADDSAAGKNPATAQPAMDTPAPLATKTLQDPTPASGAKGSSSSAAHQATSADAASTAASASAGKTAARAARSDAVRRPTREAAAKPAHPAPPRPAVDKDALATQRLIQRDLAGFLPPDSASPR